MVDNVRYVINMANSIIGVSILSMPYCFKEVGVVLGICLLLLCGFITKRTCMFLVRSATMARRRSYEMLAFQVFGVTGKLFMELCMILFLLGICISFHVVIGDLAPSIVAKYAIVENTPSLRCTLLIGIVLLIILPLCMLRNIDSLASLSACSIGFYVFLNIVIFFAALPKLLDASWMYSADLFHIEKIFNVLPIMLLAMACQSNVFEIYASIPDSDTHIMKSVVNHAINICCALYIGVGFLGYVAFNDKEIGGNIIMSFKSSKLTDGITMFFVVSLVISFPLMLFPCRTSLHSLVYKRNVQVSSFDSIGTYMPEFRFKIITFSTLAISLVIGIMIPNIEFVLGILGSTMGMWIALLLPSIFFIRVYTKLSFDRLLAQGLLFLGVFLMIMGTYLHLMNFRVKTQVVTIVPLINQIPEAPPLISEPLMAIKKSSNDVLKSHDLDATGRKEPAIPEPPALQEPENIKIENKKENIGVPEKKENLDSKSSRLKSSSNEGNQLPESGNDKSPPLGQIPINLPVEKESVIVKKEIREEVLHPDAIKKEEKENAEEKRGKEEAKEVVIEKKQEEILKKLEEHQKEQVKILEAQKEILQELKDQKEKIEVDKNDPGMDEVGVKEGAVADLGANAPRLSIQPGKLDVDPVRLQERGLVNSDMQNNLQNNQLNGNAQVIGGDQLPLPKDEPRLGIAVNPELQVVSHDDLKLNEIKQKNVISPAQYVESHANVLMKKNEQIQDLQDERELLKNDQHLKLASGVKISSHLDPKMQDSNLALDLEQNVPALKMADVNPVQKPVEKLPSRHDEERKKRDVYPVIPPDDVSISKDTLVASNNLLLPEVPLPEKSLEEGDSPKGDAVLYDSRHLLWEQRKIRRRKRRNDQYPDYWEEM